MYHRILNCPLPRPPSFTGLIARSRLSTRPATTIGSKEGRFTGPRPTTRAKNSTSDSARELPLTATRTGQGDRSKKELTNFLHNSFNYRQHIKNITQNFASPCYPQRPVWTLAELASSPEEQRKLERALDRHAVSALDFLRWRNAIVASDMSSAFAVLGDHTVLSSAAWQSQPQSQSPVLVDHSLQTKPPPIPHWLALHLIVTKIHTPAHALLAFSLSASQIPYAQGPLQYRYALLALNTLAQNHVVSTVRHAVSLFLSLPAFSPSVLHYNEVLREVAALRRSNERRLQIFRIVEEMARRRVRLDRNTYALLTRRDVLDVRLATILRARMRKERFPAEAGHHKASFMLAIRAGRNSLARGALHNLKALRRRPSPSLSTSTTAPDSKSEPSFTRFDTEYLKLRVRVGGSPSLSTVVQYLERLRESSIAPSPSSSLYLSPSSPSSSPTRLAHSQHRRWADILGLLAQTPSIEPEKVIIALRDIIGPQIQLNQVAYTAVMSGFLGRGLPGAAKMVWDEFIVGGEKGKGRGVVMDNQLLTVGIRALGEAGDIEQAWTLFERHAHMHYGDDYVVSPTTNSKGSRRGTAVNGGTKIQVDAATIGALMQQLRRAGRADVVYALWEGMVPVYGVRPNEFVLSIVLETASWASLLEQAQGIRETLALLGFRNPFKRIGSSQQTRSVVARSGSGSGPPQADLGRRIRVMLAEEEGRRRIGSWGEQPAWITAREIFRDVVFGNWPELRDVRSPASAGDDGIIDMFFRRRSAPAPKSNLEDIPPHSFPLPTSHPALGSYHFLAPSARSFHEYIGLLAAHDSAAEIPLALAWMRALKIWPTRRTLALALVAFAEVGAPAPIAESRGGGAGGHGKLVAWIKEWVGERNYPRDEEIQKARAMMGRSGTSTAR